VNTIINVLSVWDGHGNVINIREGLGEFFRNGQVLFDDLKPIPNDVFMRPIEIGSWMMRNWGCCGGGMNFALNEGTHPDRLTFQTADGVPWMVISKLSAQLRMDIIMTSYYPDSGNIYQHVYKPRERRYKCNIVVFGVLSAKTENAIVRRLQLLGIDITRNVRQ